MKIVASRWNHSRDKTPSGFDTIEFAVSEIAAGRAVVVVDDEDRENEGDLIFAAELATPQLVAFTVRYSSGVICVALSGSDCERLDLPPMHQVNQDRKGTAFTVAVDAKEGVSTGISAAERTRTIKLLADPTTLSDDLTRPGHVFPLRAREGGVLVRPGHTEAAADLTTLAGLRSSGGVVRDRERQRNNGAAAGITGFRSPASSGAHLDCRFDRLSPATRGTHPPGRQNPAAAAAG